jgi:hypothetical protein
MPSNARSAELIAVWEKEVAHSDFRYLSQNDIEAIGSILLAAAEAREAGEKCGDCGGTGIERSGVCHCGQSMDGHSAYDNHGVLEMERACESCTAALKAQLATAAEVIEACRVALDDTESGAWDSHYGKGLSVSYARSVSTARKNALALCARWKEANGGSTQTKKT